MRIPHTPDEWLTAAVAVVILAAVIANFGFWKIAGFIGAVASAALVLAVIGLWATGNH